MLGVLGLLLYMDVIEGLLGLLAGPAPPANDDPPAVAGLAGGFEELLNAAPPEQAAPDLAAGFGDLAAAPAPAERVRYRRGEPKLMKVVWEARNAAAAKRKADAEAARAKKAEGILDDVGVDSRFNGHSVAGLAFAMIVLFVSTHLRLKDEVKRYQ